MQAINDAIVQAILVDWRTAPIDQKLRATLGFLQKLALCLAEVAAADVNRVRAAGVSDQAIEDPIYVCFIVSVLTRLADAFDFDLTTPYCCCSASQSSISAEVMVKPNLSVAGVMTAHLRS